MKISYSDQTCIKEVLSFIKVKDTLLVASLICNRYKNDPDQAIKYEDFSNYENSILGLDLTMLKSDLIEYDYGSTYILSDEGKRFIQLIKVRKQTRYLLKKGCDLFPENANIAIK